MSNLISLDLTQPVPIAMPFGKHKHKAFEEIPSDYIQWVLGEDIDDLLKQELKLEWNSRDKHGEHFFSEEYEARENP